MVAGLFHKRSRTVLIPLSLMMVKMGVVILFSENGMLQLEISGEKDRSIPLIKTWLDGVGEEQHNFFLQLEKVNTNNKQNMIRH